LWVTMFDQEGQGQTGLGRIDPESGRVDVLELPPGFAPYSLAAAPDGSLWFSDFEFSSQPRRRHVARLDPGSSALTIFDLPTDRDGVTGFAFPGDGTVWLANYQHRGLLRLDPRDGSFERITTPPPDDTSNRETFLG